ncbi:MAG: aldo/keto reductase [Sciscionella sp.]
MRTITLGKTGLEVSRIAFGTWQVGGDWGAFDEQRAIAAVNHARELGINFFDTAQGYGFGTAEELLGNALRNELRGNRDELVIATKGGINPGAERPRDARGDYLRKGVESSLRHLGIDYIDLYQVHWPDSLTPAEETAGALQELVDAGKIRHAGVSNYNAAQLAEFDAVRPVETLQPPYHLLRRGVETDVLPYTREHNIGVLAYSPLASGLLTGTWDQNVQFDPDDWRSQASGFHGDKLRTNVAVVERLKALAADRGVSVSQLSLAWVLAQTGVHVAIVGARRRDSIENSAVAADIDLTAEDLTAIERIVADAVPVEGATPEGVD